MKEVYQKLVFRRATLQLIQHINKIVGEYRDQGYLMTVRQLYYQLVARDFIPNNEKSYKSVIGTVSDGRLAGLIDWDMIEDRTREFTRVKSWESGTDILRACAQSFHTNRWYGQEARVFCIVEKEALASVVQRACTDFDVPMLAARGYPSSTVLREFGKWHVLHCATMGLKTVILHLGDHDPSGIDMSRDLEERLQLFSRYSPFEFKRIALNYDQVEELKPPPNPAKTSDSRFSSYKEKFGDQSWELDALSPSYLNELISTEIQAFIEPEAWSEAEATIEHVKSKLSEIAENFNA